MGSGPYPLPVESATPPFAFSMLITIPDAPSPLWETVLSSAHTNDKSQWQHCVIRMPANRSLSGHYGKKRARAPWEEALRAASYRMPAASKHAPTTQAPKRTQGGRPIAPTKIDSAEGTFSTMSTPRLVSRGFELTHKSVKSPSGQVPQPRLGLGGAPGGISKVVHSGQARVIITPAKKQGRDSEAPAQARESRIRTSLSEAASDKTWST
jgi:hypothetical protein